MVMRPNLGFYVQTINDIVKTTEDIGEVMNPYYEEVRQAIDKNKVNDLTAERIAEIQAKFKEGTEKYELIIQYTFSFVHKKDMKKILNSLVIFISFLFFQKNVAHPRNGKG